MHLISKTHNTAGLFYITLYHLPNRYHFKLVLSVKNLIDAVSSPNSIMMSFHEIVTHYSQFTWE